MTSSHLNEMVDVTSVNVFPRKLMKFPHKGKVNSVPYPLLPFLPSSDVITTLKPGSDFDWLIASTSA